VIALLLACDDRPARSPAGDEEPRPEAVLGDMTVWGPAVAADPFDDIPEGGVCPIGGTFVEGQTFEANTGVCTYVWTEQPLLADLVPGDTVEVVFWHSTLVSDLPADAHLAFAVDGSTLYDRRVPIPSGYLAYTETAEVDFEAEAGAPLGLHLHNHGANTWNVLRLTRLAYPLEQ
jgi:hypothetical protein